MATFACTRALGRSTSRFFLASQKTSGRFLSTIVNSTTTTLGLNLQTTTSENVVVTAGAGSLPVTTSLKIIDTAENREPLPLFRVLNPQGKLIGADPWAENTLDAELAAKMYRMMVRIQCLDDIMYNAQRQGRISFYMQASGEEAIHIGSALALDDKDLVFAQYREQGVLLWRGFSVQQAADQCFSNEKDLGKGRQMPVHYGSKELHYQTISSPLGTQIPQAVGAAYAFKARQVANLPICYFGEGAASEGDFHAAMNFAATLEVPVIFLCRNNGYAISTPVQDQYRGDGIGGRASGYGMHVIRVDGNDIFAMRSAVAEARKLALEKNKPVFIEAMSYRLGHHSTSDDSTRYRSINEIKEWQEKHDPLARFRLYMESRGWWDSDKERAVRDEERLAVIQAMEKAEKRPKPPLKEMFEDVYEQKPLHILKQEAELLEHVNKYPEHYLNDAHH